jgi:hypothetical protein
MRAERLRDFLHAISAERLREIDPANFGTARGR